MNDKFFDLKKEKQDRMINAALKIFAENGFRRASTDEMVKEAGISKGLLFHYFTSKTGLFEFVYDYSVKYITLEMTSAVNREESNYFAIRRQIEKAKAEAMKHFPYMQMFLLQAEKENSTDNETSRHYQVTLFSRRAFTVRMTITEKKPEYAVHAKELKGELRTYLNLKELKDVRVLVRYDIENLSEETYQTWFRAHPIPGDILFVKRRVSQGCDCNSI